MAAGFHPNIDIYDEEFNNYLNLAKVLINRVKRGSDRKICTKWITKLCKLESDDPTVKKNRNDFFRYMLIILHRSIDARPPKTGYDDFPQYYEKHDKMNESLGGKSFMSRWSNDKRTYVAVKPIPHGGALVYMAVAKEPNMGWEYAHR